MKKPSVSYRRIPTFAYASMDIQATGIMEDVEGVKMMSQVDLTVTLTVPTDTSEKIALKILTIAEQRCPLANSVKTRITTIFTISYV